MGTSRRSREVTEETDSFCYSASPWIAVFLSREFGNKREQNVSGGGERERGSGGGGGGQERERERERESNVGLNKLHKDRAVNHAHSRCPLCFLHRLSISTGVSQPTSDPME